MKNGIIGLVVMFGAIAGTRYVIDAIMVKEQVNTVAERADDRKSEPVISIAEGKASWMEGCDTGEYSGPNFDQTVYCGCAFDKLVEHHGLNWVINVGLNDTEEEAQAKITPETTACFDEQIAESTI